MSNQVRQTFKLEAAGALTVGANKDRWQAPFDGQIISASVVVGTAPTGATAIFDLLLDGVTVFGALPKPTVAISGTEGAADADQSVSRFVKGQTVGLSVTQIGSTVAGSDADVVVQYIAS